MVRTVRRNAPSIEFHAPRALAADPVGIGAPQPGVLDRLVRVHCDFALRRFGHDFHVVALHHLAFGAFARLVAIGMHVAQVAGVGDVAGLDRLHPACGHQVEPGFELAFVIADIAAGLVMAHDRHALFGSVAGKFLKVIIGIAFGETEFAAVEEPVSVPADIPTFDQHALEPVFRSEVDVALHVFGGGTVLQARTPGFLLEVERPPYADIFVRFEPADVTEPVRLVEVELHKALGKARGIVGDTDRAPWRCKRQITLGTCRA